MYVRLWMWREAEKSKFFVGKVYFPFAIHFFVAVQSSASHYFAQIRLLMFLMRAKRKNSRGMILRRLGRLISSFAFASHWRDIFHHDNFMADISFCNMAKLITMTERKENWTAPILNYHWSSFSWSVFVRPPLASGDEMSMASRDDRKKVISRSNLHRVF